jgi:hypothetical protein
MAVTRDAAGVLIEKELDGLLKEVELRLDADCLSFVGPIHTNADDFVRMTIEARSARRASLAVLLETDGGYIEVVERIVRVLRKHYDRVVFIVPSRAMSAGTVFVMSGDAIYMDYYSILGPIDPQVPRSDGNGMVPALGYLAEYNRLIKKSQAGELTTAEMAFLIQKFDPAELHDYKQAKELSISLLKEWLVKYKFKDWNETGPPGKRRKVDDQVRESRAEEIAKLLNKTTRWHSHGRGIPMALLVSELRLKIEDMEKTPELHNAVKKYHALLSNYMGKTGGAFVLHMTDDFGLISGN